MNTPQHSSDAPLNDWDIVTFDGPSDTTVRPVRPELRKHLEAEREKIRLYADGRDDRIDIIDIDGPSDTTVRPVRPEARARLEAEREKIRRWQEQQKRVTPQPPDADQGAT